MRWIMERDTWGILQPGERCTKTGWRVMEVLRTKRLEACPPTAASLDSYPYRPPELVPVDITNNTVTAVAGRLLVGARAGGTDSVGLKYGLLRFGPASGELWLIFREFT